MDILFKRHFVIVRLAFISAGAWLIARTFNVFVETSIAPLPPQHQQSASSVLHSPSVVDPQQVARTLGLPWMKPVEKSNLGENIDPAPVRSSLRLKLLGTLVSERMPEWSISSIQHTGTMKVATYLMGDRIEGAEVLQVERSRVIILNNNRREFIDSAPSVTAALEKPNLVSDARPSLALGSTIKHITDNAYEISRTEIAKILANLDTVGMQARMVPAFKDGIAQGFKIFAIQSNSVFSKIGIENGDVVKRINGFELNSAVAALEIYSRLQNSAHIEIEVERNGTPVRKTYNVN